MENISLKRIENAQTSGVRELLNRRRISDHIANCPFIKVHFPIFSEAVKSSFFRFFKLFLISKNIFQKILALPPYHETIKL